MSARWLVAPLAAFVLTRAIAAPCGTAVIPDAIGIGDPAAPAGLNPLLATDPYTLQVATLLYRPLVWIGRDIAFNPERSLAASITPSQANQRFRIVLKPWRWSNGSFVTSDDVLFGWERVLKLGALFGAVGQGGIPGLVQSVQVIDPHTVDFVLKQPANADWFILNGLSLIYALPRHAWGDLDAGDMWRRQNDPTLFNVTDGPFRLAELRRDRYFAFVPNPLYGGHAALLARLVIVFLEGGGALHELQDGEIDMARVPYPLWQRLHATSGFSFHVLDEPYGYGDLILNHRSKAAPFLRDASIRRALEAAIDQQSIIRLAYGGFGSENHIPAPAVPSWRSPAHRSTSKSTEFDPQAARAALQAAGYTPGPGGVRQKNGAPLAFTILTGADPDGPEMEMLQIIQANLRDADVAVKLRSASFAQQIATLSTPGADWDAATLPVTPPPMPDGFGYWNEAGIDAYNFGAYSDGRMDALIQSSVRQPGRDGLFAYQDYFAKQQPGIILPQGNQLLMAASRLRGVEEFSNAEGYWSPEYLSVIDAACPAAVAGRSDPHG